MITEELIDQSAHRAEQARAAALQSLAANPNFRDIWVEGYLREDVENKLQQLRTAPVEDLPVARQRWLDAEAAYRHLKSDIERILNPPPDLPV